MGNGWGTRIVFVGALVATALVTPAPGAHGAPPVPRFSRVVLPAVPPQIPQVQSAANGAGSPTVFVDKQDRVFITGASLAPEAPLVWRSLDRGRSFSYVGQPGQSPFSNLGVPMNPIFDVDIEVAPDDGRLYWVGLAGAGFSEFVYNSRDAGTTWSPTPAFVGTAQDRPWIGTGPNGLVYVMSHDLFDTAKGELFKSTDHGQTFLPVVPGGFALGPGGYVTLGEFVVDPSDPQHLAVFFGASPSEGTGDTTTGASPTNQVWVAVSHDGGATWRQSKAYGDASVGYTLIRGAMDKGGRLFTTFVEKDATTTATHVFLASSDDDGATWSAPLQVDTRADRPTNVFPSVTAAKGHVDIAWYTSADDYFDNPSATWTAALSRVRDPFGASPSVTQVQLSRGIVHTGALCTQASSCLSRGDNSFLFLEFLTVTAGPDGRTSVAYNEDPPATADQRTPLTVYARES